MADESALAACIDLKQLSQLAKIWLCMSKQTIICDEAPNGLLAHPYPLVSWQIFGINNLILRKKERSDDNLKKTIV